MLSLREVARRVDYSPAGLYEYFGSKEEIAVALVSEGFRRLSQYLRQVPEDLPAPEHVIQLGMAYLEFARSHRQHYRFMFSYATSLEGLEEGDRQVSGYGTYERLERAVRAGIEAGDFVGQGSFTLDVMCYSIWALVHGMAMMQLENLDRYVPNLPAFDRQVIATFVRGLMPE